MNRLTLTHRRLRRLILLRRRPLAALCAAVAVAAGLQAASAPPPATTSVLTAAHDLAGGSVIGAGDLTRVEFSPDSVPRGVVADPARAVGRTTTGPVRAGEPITDVRLVHGSLLDGYPGAVAAPVRIADAGAVELLRVGDVVDVISADPQGAREPQVVAGDAPVISLPERDDSGSGMVAGGLVVLAVSDETSRSLAAAGVSGLLSIAIKR